ncbi:hypothetical protein N658DRAFT_210545 [Parathielavia hyrcaniae]|uniref:Uncharacterized protein n=1 Tax=Parathielavia hyrcaniae TaxID=113614 RepID=A0AAN6SYS5_9PEZI|nr:hypothetical protein N658DRAFT_210545 [Parathielavia hyrcaniae]
MSDTRGSKRASDHRSPYGTPKRPKPSAPEPGPRATPHTPSDTARPPAPAVPGSACAYLLVGSWSPRSFPVPLDTILVEVSTFDPPQDHPVDALSAIVRGDDIIRPLDDAARYPLDGLTTLFDLSDLQI